MTAPVETGMTSPGRRFSGWQVLLLLLAVVALTVGATVWVLRNTLYPSPFEPVHLTFQEQARLDTKLRQIGIDPDAWGPRAPERGAAPPALDRPLEPEPYREDPSKREIGISERELNALLAHNTNLAHRFAIDLSDDLASAKLLVPMDPDLPVLGGRILRVHAGLQLEYRDRRPLVMLRGISVMGVPLPNAWLGNLKNVDLVQEFGGGPGFWKSFADGIDFVEVREGELKIKLRE